MKLLEHFHKLSIYPSNAKELKGLVLQLAVQGKLTEDWRLANPDVESAAVLLERIKAEKQELIKTKKIKKEKALPVINKDEVPFELPDSWAWCRLGDYIHNFGQKKPDKKFTYIDVGSINKEVGTISKSLKILTPSEAPSRARKIIKKGCVLYSTVRPNLLNIALVERDFSYEPIASTAFAILNPLLGAESKYLYYVLRSNIFTEYVSSQMLGVAYPAINDKKLKLGGISVPPIQEQKAIVKIVDTLLQEVTQLEQLTQQRLQLKEKYVTAALNQVCEENTAKAWADLKGQFSTFFNEEGNVKKLRETILQLAVQGKLTANWRAANPNVEPAADLLERIKTEKQELIKAKKIKKEKALPAIEADEVPYALPEGWVWCRMGEIINIKSSKRIFKSDYVKEGVPFFRSKEIGQLGRNENITNTLFIERSKYEKLKTTFGVPKYGDILIACIGGSIGNTWLVDNREFYYKDGNLVQLGMIPEVESIYVLNYLRSKIFYNTAIGNVSGSAYNALTIEKIKKSLFPYPPLQEQKAIVEKVNQLMDFCDNLEEEIIKSKKTAEELMQVVLKEVFEGKVVETV